eukprot:TRINITY_DN59220_c0_g1_i1.p1 TRINITY_DN59220_c0_g1~~TRINITY_DN59220_c0_g1_i1.p1  ORF type:complete len:748 (+),score=214.25 TRINITY_DN59220_c0_g1_i1:96-2339(+)
MVHSWPDQDPSAIGTIRRELVDAQEEARTWRIRCLQAEAEVRALKRSGLHAVERSPPAAGPSDGNARGGGGEGVVSPASPPAASSGSAAARGDNNDGGNRAFLEEEVERLRQQLQTAEEAAAPKEPATQSGLSGIVSMASTTSPLEEPPGVLAMGAVELRQQLQKKNMTIVQLQSDLVRERKESDRQIRQAEADGMMKNEELREMTTRATQLSDQVRKSKKRAAELTAAQEEAEKLKSDLEECETRLMKQASTGEQHERDLKRSRMEVEAWEAHRKTLSEEVAELEASRRRSKTLDAEQVALEERLEKAGVEEVEAKQHAVALSELEEASGPSSLGRIRSSAQQVDSCASALGQLQASLQRELQAAGLSTSASSSAERLLALMGKQIERVGRLARSDAPGRTGRGGDTSASSPQDAPITDKVGSLQQELNAARLASARLREDLLAEHCDELDDLVRRHDNERRGLHSELAQLRSEKTVAEARKVTIRPLEEIRDHFEKQVASMKKDLVSQLGDLQKKERDQRAKDERDLEDLVAKLGRCQSELSSSQKDFEVMAVLFDQERREHQELRESSRRLEDFHCHSSLDGAGASAQQAPDDTYNDVTVEVATGSWETWETCHGMERDRVAEWLAERSGGSHHAGGKAAAGSPHRMQAPASRNLTAGSADVTVAAAAAAAAAAAGGPMTLGSTPNSRRSSKTVLSPHPLARRTVAAPGLFPADVALAAAGDLAALSRDAATYLSAQHRRVTTI